jgi:hypothetical protein
MESVAKTVVNPSHLCFFMNRQEERLPFVLDAFVINQNAKRKAVKLTSRQPFSCEPLAIWWPNLLFSRQQHHNAPIASFVSSRITPCRSFCRTEEFSYLKKRFDCIGSKRSFLFQRICVLRRRFCDEISKLEADFLQTAAFML